MKLFCKPGVCSLALHITPHESGKGSTLGGADLVKKRLENGGNFFAVNPKGQVSALLPNDGTLLTGGVAIIRYLTDSVPDRQLLAPTSNLSCHKAIEWFNYIAIELYKGFTPPFRPDTPEDLRLIARMLLEKKIQYVNDSLKDNQWICDPCFSIADTYPFTVLCWAYTVKLNMARLSNTDAYMTRIIECPTVAAALKTGGLN